MNKRILVAAALALLSAPVMAQTPPPTMQQQVDAIQGQIDRLVANLATFVLQEQEEIKQLQYQAQLAATQKPTPPSSPILPRPPHDKDDAAVK